MTSKWTTGCPMALPSSPSTAAAPRAFQRAGAPSTRTPIRRLDAWTHDDRVGLTPRVIGPFGPRLARARAQPAYDSPRPRREQTAGAARPPRRRAGRRSPNGSSTCASTRCRGAAADAGAGGENVRDLRRDDRADRHITVTTDAG